MAARAGGKIGKKKSSGGKELGVAASLKPRRPLKVPGKSARQINFLGSTIFCNYRPKGDLIGFDLQDLMHKSRA